MTSKQFKTHEGNIISGKTLEKVLHKVACDMEKSAENIYNNDPYASHVTQTQKLENLHKSYDSAENIRRGENLHNFTIWQRVNTELTGQCIGFLNKKKGKKES